jgi:hypothetical protein
MKRAIVLLALVVAPLTPQVPPDALAAPAHRWPTDASAEPEEAAWAKAAALETVTLSLKPVPWLPAVKVTCSQRAIREWVRITCTPVHDPKHEVFMGVVWGMAGGLDEVKASFSLASELERFRVPVTDPFDRFGPLTRKMGASTTVTFPVRPGSAFVLSLDTIGWVDEYDGRNLSVGPGLLLDVSWARGEKGPSIGYR